MAPLGPLPPPLEPPGGGKPGELRNAALARSRTLDSLARWIDARHERVARLLRWAMVALFVGAGTAKLLGQPNMVTLFAMVGLDQWFRYAVGSYELVGAALLAGSKTAALGAWALVLLMLGAAATEILILDRPPLSSGVTLAGLLMLIAVLRRAP